LAAVGLGAEGGFRGRGVRGTQTAAGGPRNRSPHRPGLEGLLAGFIWHRLGIGRRTLYSGRIPPFPAAGSRDR
jgi:hypothetical protein